jgi:hypothetical protein
MRRIGRYILNGLTVLSLLLCVAAMATAFSRIRKAVVLPFKTGD